MTASTLPGIAQGVSALPPARPSGRLAWRERIDALARAHATPELRARMRALVAHARQINSAVTSASAPLLSVLYASAEDGERLVLVAFTAVEQGASLVDAEAWLALLMSAATEDVAHLLHLEITRWATSICGAYARAEIPGTTAALAFAAGVGIREATAHPDALDASVLRSMAALRGWHFPAPLSGD